MQNPKHTPDQMIETVSLEGSSDMNKVEQSKNAARAPLYSSPWLAFFYVIRQGWSQTRP